MQRHAAALKCSYAGEGYLQYHEALSMLPQNPTPAPVPRTAPAPVTAMSSHPSTQSETMSSHSSYRTAGTMYTQPGNRLSSTPSQAASTSSVYRPR